MNNHALNTLEFPKILNTLSEKAISDQGKKALLNLTLSADRERIQNQFLEIDEAKAILNTGSSVPLQNLSGMHQVIDKINKEQILNPEDLWMLAQMLRGIQRLINFMKDRMDIAPTIAGYVYSLLPLKELIEAIHDSIAYNEVLDDATPTLAKIRKRQLIIKDRIKSKLESMVNSSAYQEHLQETTITLRDDHYVIAVKSSSKGKIPGAIIGKSSTGSTLFIEPAIIGSLQGEYGALKQDESNEIYQLLTFLTGLVAEHQQAIELNMEALVQYDVIFAKARYAKEIHAESVQISYTGHTIIKNGRHPLLGKGCIPLNMEIGDNYRGLIITGPNTGGKTVALKTLGLLILMVEAGLQIPANKESSISLFSEILVDIGDGQDIAQSLSTFSSHIKNISGILKVANKYTLVLLDELGSGTDPKEGEGLAVAILKALYEKGATIMATSHYGGVKNFGEKTPGFINGHMTFDIGTLSPLYQLKIGVSGSSNALIIAQKLGMDKGLIEDAYYETYGEYKSFEMSAPVPVEATYQKANKPKAIQREKIKSEQVIQKQSHIFEIGDAVFVHTIKQRGIVFEGLNKKDEIGVRVRGKKMYVPYKRLTLEIERNQLYPDAQNYDYTIVTESVDFRKKNKQMGRKFQKDMTIVHREGSAEKN